MGLAVETPTPPALTDATTDVPEDRRIEAGMDVHRADLDDALHEGAWDRGFGEWAEHTDLDETEWAVVEDLQLVAEFDFFWDGTEGRVGYTSPGIPPNWRQRDLHPALDSWSTVSSINAALADLGRVVATVLTEEYVEWDDTADREST